MFSVGERVVCIADWWDILIQSKHDSKIDPKKHEVCVIKGIYDTREGVFFEIAGYEGTMYCSTRFRKLDYDFVEEVLKLIQERPVEIA